MHIGQPRQPIEDCPAVYFVEPTSANVRLVVQDLKQGLYAPAYVNFISSVPRPLLEELAAEAASSGTAELVSRVYDQYLNFVVAEPDLFSLNLQQEHTYYALNSPKTTEEQLGFLVDRIISGLFSVVATMGRSGRPGQEQRWMGKKKETKKRKKKKKQKKKQKKKEKHGADWVGGL